MIYVVLHGSCWYKQRLQGLCGLYKESYWYKWRLQCLCGFTNTGTNGGSIVNVVLKRIIPVQINRGSSVYAVLQLIILVQMETPVSMWFYKESYWYKWRLHFLCGSTKKQIGTNGGSIVYVVLQRSIQVQIEPLEFRLFYNESQ